MSTKKLPFNTVYGNQPKEPGYISYAGKGGAEKYKDATSNAIAAVDSIARAAFLGDTYQNLRPGISGRPEFNRGVYEYFRPGEALPKRYRDAVVVCDNIYYYISLVRNVIDLMSDFACQGIKLVHPVKSQERFYNAWFKKINGFDRSERFLNYLYRHAMVVTEARVGEIDIPTEREYTSLAGIEGRKIKTREIPLQYIFHYPALVKPTNNINSDKVKYTLLEGVNFDGVGVPNQPVSMKTGKERKLPEDKTFVYYYKKDDWQVEPVPFLVSLVKHAIMLEKLALADSAALDGAISAVRIFKLGDVEHQIAATETAVAKLDEILQSHVGGGTLDIIWPGPIELIESKTDVHNFLGEGKYVFHLEQMYNGLGIPSTLAGKGGTGTTNNYISLKTLTKRLQYGRKILIDFWDDQVKWVQKSMGFARPAKMEFDFLDLGDEHTEKALLIQLADRNLISDEKLQSIFGYDADMEKARLNRESRERKSGRRVEKQSSLNDPFMVALKKIAAQKGYATLDQLGLKLEDGTEKQKTPFDRQMDAIKQRGNGQTSVPQKGKSARGRPQGAKDSKKRTRVFKPKVKASLEIWAADAQNKIYDIVKAELLKMYGKKNLRQLSQKETENYEKLGRRVLFSVEPFTDITNTKIVESLEKGIDSTLLSQSKEYIDEIKEEVGRELTFDEVKKIDLIIYSSIYGEKDVNS